MARFAAMLDAPGGIDQAAMLRERVSFSQNFTAHLVREQAEIGQMVRVRPDLAETARRYGERLARLRAAYSEHVNRWTPARIEASPPGYRAAVLDLQRMLYDLMAWEEQSLPLFH